jgi:hypothetical protein
MHLLAYILVEAAFETCLLSGTRWHRYDHLVRLFFYVVPYEDAPGKVPEGLHKSL